MATAVVDYTQPCMRSTNVHSDCNSAAEAEEVGLACVPKHAGDWSRRRCVKPSCKLQQFSLSALRAWSVARHGCRQEQENFKGQEGWQEEGVSACLAEELLCHEIVTNTLSCYAELTLSPRKTGMTSRHQAASTLATLARPWSRGHKEQRSAGT